MWNSRLGCSVSGKMPNPQSCGNYLIALAIVGTLRGIFFTRDVNDSEPNQPQSCKSGCGVQASAGYSLRASQRVG